MTIKQNNDPADLSTVLPRWLHWLLMDEEHGVVNYANPDSEAVIERVAGLLQRQIDGETVTQEEWESAASAADDAAVFDDDVAAMAAADVYAGGSYIGVCAATTAGDAAAGAAAKAHHLRREAFTIHQRNKVLELLQETTTNASCKD